MAVSIENELGIVRLLALETRSWPTMLSAAGRARGRMAFPGRDRGCAVFVGGLRPDGPPAGGRRLLVVDTIVTAAPSQARSPSSQPTRYSRVRAARSFLASSKCCGRQKTASGCAKGNHCDRVRLPTVSPSEAPPPRCAIAIPEWWNWWAGSWQMGRLTFPKFGNSNWSSAMVRFLAVVSLAVAGSSGLSAQITTGDASRGEQLVRDRGCVGCHKLNGAGGNKARSATRRSRDFTPAAWPACCGATLLRVGASRRAVAGNNRHHPAEGPTCTPSSLPEGISIRWATPARRRFSPGSAAPLATASPSALPRMPCRYCLAFLARSHRLARTSGIAGGHGPRVREKGRALSAAHFREMNIFSSIWITVGFAPRSQVRACRWRFGRAEFQSLQCDSCHKDKHAMDKRTDPISLAEYKP